MKEAILYKKENGLVKCFACSRRCLIPNGQLGYCKTRKNINNKLYSIYYGYFSGISYEPLKTKPFLKFHDPKTKKIFSPEELTLSVGGFGCNFKCKGCQNAQVSRIQKDIESISIKKTPKMIVEQAKKNNIKIIAFTWNEPAIMPEIVIETAKLAHENGLNTVYVSNASLASENVDMISPYIDAFRFDIKAGPSVANKFYANYCKFNIPNAIYDILETIKYVKSRDKHIEILTVLIPSYAPSCTRSVLGTALWIKENLGDMTPWHLAKFIPSYKLDNLSLKTPDSMIDYYVKMVKNLGLKNVNGIKDKGCDCYNPEKKNCCV